MIVSDSHKVFGMALWLADVSPNSRRRDEANIT